MIAISSTTSTPTVPRRRGLKAAAKQAIRAAINNVVERYLCIDTTDLAGAKTNGQHGDSIAYEPLDYPFLLRTLNAMDLQETDIVYEIGCGMGRVLCLLARRRIRRGVGIELSAELAERARANVTAVRAPKSPVHVVTGDAAMADYDDGNVFFMFHPFGPSTMRATLDRIRVSIDRRPRTVRIMYVNPFHEDVLEASGWLVCRERLRSRWFNTFASYWFSEGSSGAGSGRGEGNHDQ